MFDYYFKLTFVYFFLGFLCPVHTPDGSPCGLLNHLAHACAVTTAPTQEHLVRKLLPVLASLGVNAGIPISSGSVESKTPPIKHVSIQLDGRILGHCSP